jgi:hypothetical protein
VEQPIHLCRRVQIIPPQTPLSISVVVATVRQLPDRRV